MVGDASNIEVLSYGEVMELAYFGAKVLHPLAVTPLQDSGIPLRVKSAADPDFPGTLVRSQPEDVPGRPVKAVTAIKNVSLLTVTGAGVLGVPEVIASVFTAIARENITLLMVSQSSSMSNVSLAVPSADAGRALQALRAGLPSDLQVEETSGVAVLAIVGSGMRGQQGVSARLFAALAGEDINILMISQGVERTQHLGGPARRRRGPRHRRRSRRIRPQPAGQRLIRIPLNSCTVGTTPPVHPYREIRIFSYSFQSD